MANWYGFARSNYFRVKDAQAFRDAVAPLDVAVVIGEQPGMFALLAESESGGWPTYVVDANDEDVEVDIPLLVSEHLAPEEVAVFIEAGAEKLRYITGRAVAINANGERRTVDLNDIYGHAAQLGANVTRAEF